MATKEQALEALSSAKLAFSQWSKYPLQQRGDWMERLAQAIELKRELILDVLMSETVSHWGKQSKIWTCCLVVYVTITRKQSVCTDELWKAKSKASEA
jgi:acyl-CoA reductase-like NAD-dependent aldehyde dehydrogenase